ncbi:MAG: HlyD family efflux transporter periplasmic adaptor subunit [Humidesulfovibrio sp.]|nr:HlyD family efflux transporter periplasmic adaptor subunit [Humidesulfovibrio sp.]
MKARLAVLALVLLGATAYGVRHFVQDTAATYQGYVEAEYVHVASPVAGALSELRVSRGQEVQAGAPLFVLEQDYERAALAVATSGLKQAADRLANVQKGQRPTELKAISARLGQANTSLGLAETEFKRRQQLFAERTISAEEMDRARADYDLKVQQVREMSANLSTARLGARTDEVSAAQAEVEAAKGRVEQAAWTLAQKSQAAPAAALIFDTLYSQGEWVPAGKAVAVLLPPQNLKVRFFVPEEQVGAIRIGQEAQVRFDGQNESVPVRVSYVSAQAEYTPPMLYSSDNRAKLVFLVEARPAPDKASLLHPGQPVDVIIDVKNDVKIDVKNGVKNDVKNDMRPTSKPTK